MMMIDQNEYQEFRDTYELMHPHSKPRRGEEIQQYQPWVKWAVLFMFVCAAILSAVHTVPTIYEGIDGAKVSPELRQAAAAGSFVFVELMILLSAYLYIRNRNWAVFIGGFTFLVAAIANIQSTLLSFGNAAQASLWTMVVSVLIGLLAPVVCLAAGKLYVNIQHAQTEEHARVQQHYDTALRQWDTEIRNAYEQHLKQARKRVPRNTQKQVETPMPRSETRNNDAPALVRMYLLANQEQMGLSVRKLSEMISEEHGPVSPTTVHRVKEQLKQELALENGNGTGNGNSVHVNGFPREH